MLKKISVIAAICIYLFAFLFVFVVPVSGAFSSVIITDVKPTEFHPGETKEVVLTVKNNGGADARDVRLAFEGKESVSLVGTTVVQINTLNSWCSKEVKIIVHVKEGTPNGVYSIPIKCSWYEYYFDPTQGYISRPNTITYVPGIGYVETDPVTLGISFNVKGDVLINVGNVYTDPAHVRPGDEDVRVIVAIANSGDADAKDVEARLLCNEQFEPSWSGTDRVYIGSMNAGKGYSGVTFHLDIADNVDAGVYSIPLYIIYKDTENIQYITKTSLDVLVEPKPDFEILSYYTEPTNISAGDYVILHVRVRNVGSEEAESVSVRLTGEADVPFDFNVTSSHVGNLKVNESGDALLKFNVDEAAAEKIYRQGLEIRCTGDRDLGDYNVYIFDKQIQLEVTSSSSESSSLLGSEVLIYFIALLLISLFFFAIYFFMKKRR